MAEGNRKLLERLFADHRGERPGGVLIAFARANEWLEYGLENDARFYKRVTAAQARLGTGEGIRPEDMANSMCMLKKNL